MAIDGQKVKFLSRSLRTIADTADEIVRQARTARVSGPQSIVGARFPAAPVLERMDDAAFATVAERAFEDLAWVNDGWCSGRSLLTAQQLADAAKIPLGKSVKGASAGGSGMSALTDSLAGAVAIADGPFVMSNGRRWEYHAAAVGWPASSPEPMVIDGVLFSRPVTLSAWTRRLKADPATTKLRHPWDLRGLSISESVTSGAQRVNEYLSKSVRELARSGKVVDNDLARGIPIDGPMEASRQVNRGAWLASRSSADTAFLY